MSAMNRILHSEVKDYSDDRANLPFTEVGLDSFDLISLRIAFENDLGQPIPDRIWTTLKTPADLLRAAAVIASGDRGSFARSAAGPAARRDHVINMPQMVLSGLSESWLFKEIGDFHWNLIADGLATQSSQMRDGNGDRLYATFSRVRIDSAVPLTSYIENDPLTIVGDIARFGGGLFFGSFSGASGDKRFSAQVMSSFTKRSAEASNKDLMKGQPTIPPDSPIRILTEKPDFGEEYRARRNITFLKPLFECDYEINPYHDINGVGLIYFAAYPLISDTCELRYMGEGNKWATRASTLSRDVCYFANSDAEDKLVYSVLSRTDEPGVIELQSLISRKGGRTPMALITTRKAVRDV